jgi:hypothetical protein
MIQFSSEKRRIHGNEYDASERGAKLDQNPIWAVGSPQGNVVTGREPFQKRVRYTLRVTRQRFERPTPAVIDVQSAVNESDLLAVAIGRPKKGSADWLLDQRNAFVLLTKRFG